MSIALLVMDGPEPAVPPTPWVRLSELVSEAAALTFAPEPFEIVAPGELPDGQQLAAVLYEESTRPTWTDGDVPSARVAILMDVTPGSPGGPGRGLGALIPMGEGTRIPASLRVWANDRPGAVQTISAWLASNVDARLGDQERRYLEIVSGEILRAIHDGKFDGWPKDDVAQAQAAVDTVTAQMRSPRASRRIIGIALAQLPGFVAGGLSTVGASYLAHLVSHFPI